MEEKCHSHCKQQYLDYLLEAEKHPHLHSWLISVMHKVFSFFGIHFKELMRES